MMKPVPAWILLLFVISCGTGLRKNRPEHWSYHEKGGPEKWGTLASEYKLCSTGQKQSPVDLVPTPSGIFEKWELDYTMTGLNVSHNEHMEELIDNGHTIQVTPDEGSYISFNGKNFQLKQFHFHTPSEHTLNGKHAPMEVHFVHQSDDKRIVVVGVMVEEGEKNQNITQFLQNLPNAVGEKKKNVNIRFNPQAFLSKDLMAWHYMGSLTTPPCVEGVQWLVLRKPIHMSKDQIAEFSRRLHHNNRPVQPINARRLTNDEIIIRRNP